MSSINPSNVFECSQKMIQKIEDRNDLVEALLWATVVSVYQDEIARLSQEVADVRKENAELLRKAIDK